MRLKYKKIILLATMSTMGIGLLTLSVTNDRLQAKSNPKNSTAQEAGDLNSFSVDTGEAAPTTTAAPSPTPLPVYHIDKDTNPEIQQLFEDFYKAKNNRDITTLKKLLSDPSEVESQEDLKKKTQYIEEYSNIKAYAKKGFEKGTYIVYVYHEIKFTGINTPAPGLSKFYLVTGEDNKLKIFSGTMDDATKAYFNARNDDEDVVALIKMTDEKSEAAIKKDKDLKSFWNNIEKLANKDSAIKSEKTTTE